MSTLNTYKEHRFATNPQEKIFVEEFIKQHSQHNDMDFIVFGCGTNGNYPQDILSEREKKIALSVIQWLGSPVGRSFLLECGFEAKKRKIKYK